MLSATRALVSVSNKTGLVELAQGLAELGIEIISTGGTRKYLEDAGITVFPVSEVTGSPEILDGRVKTLHPKIHGGILADRARASHLSELQEHGIHPIDLVVVNLYPFEETAARPGASPEEVVENIDIGGPTMLRAAAKNYGGVAVVVDPDDYPRLLQSLRDEGGSIPEAMRRELAIKAFRHTQSYDTAIASWLEEEGGEGQDQGGDVKNPFPSRLRVDLDRELALRYGENPHQTAAIYRTVGQSGLLGGFQQFQGKELSWNNLLDADAARKLVSLFTEPTVAIIKHNNPCGVGRGDDLATAYERALECDPVSAFGSIVALNRPATLELAEKMSDLFVEVVIAPSYEEEARKRLRKKRQLRLLQCPIYSPEEGEVELRPIAGGYLAQTLDVEDEQPETWTTETRLRPSEEQIRALHFAWTVMRFVKSNAIVVTQADQTVGIGAGQMSRVDSCRLALEKAQLPVGGTVAASDAFFPFRDGLDVLADAGVAAVVQPGGSRRDEEVIHAAEERGLVMMFTGRRHFKH